MWSTYSTGPFLLDRWIDALLQFGQRADLLRRNITGRLNFGWLQKYTPMFSLKLAAELGAGSPRVATSLPAMEQVKPIEVTVMKFLAEDHLKLGRG